MDSTGFSTCTYERWFDHKWGKERSRQKWTKLHAMTGVLTNIVTAAMISDGHANDTTFMRPLLASTQGNFPMREVSADKAYCSKSNMATIEEVGATPYIPFRGSLPSVQAPMPGLEEGVSIFRKMQYLFAYRPRHVPGAIPQAVERRMHVLHDQAEVRRSPAVKVRDRADERDLCKVIAHNLCVLIACVHEMGMPMPELGVGVAA